MQHVKTALIKPRRQQDRSTERSVYAEFQISVKLRFKDIDLESRWTQAKNVAFLSQQDCLPNRQVWIR